MVNHQKGRAAEPKFSRIVEALAGFRNAGGEYLTISGGEPGLRRDLPALIDEANALGFRITLFTNGLAAKKAVLKSLERAKGNLALSVDGPTATVHEALRGLGTFDPAVVTLRRVVSEIGGEHVILSCLLSRPLIGVITRLWEFAAQEGIGVLYIGIFEPVAPGLLHPLMPTDDEVVGPILELLGLAEKQQTVKLAFSESDDLLRSQGVFSRRMPETVLGRTIKVQAEGWALPGPFYYAGNFRLGCPMEEGWAKTLASPVFDMLRKQAMDKAEKTPACRSCFWARRCGGGSLALTWATYGTWTHTCPLCQVYKATLERAATMEIQHAFATHP